MTKEEAKDKFTDYMCVPSMETRKERIGKAFDEIYDDFESRTCGNCKNFDTAMDEDCEWDGYCDVLGDYFNSHFYYASLCVKFHHIKVVG